MSDSRILHFWDWLRSSFWFLPALMAAAAAGLSFGMVAVDGLLEREMVRTAGWIYTGGADGARQLLSTIASSMITVAGVTFSITVVALTLASSQFGPRLLRNFMRDTGNQVVLGTFIATFLYCLLVLRTVRGDTGQSFVPHISVTLGVVLGMASLGVLIYFIHHVSASMQAGHVIAAVGGELDAAIDRVFPEKLGEAPPGRAVLPPELDRRGRRVTARDAGYLQAVEGDRLLGLARAHDLLLRLPYRPGQFVIPGDVLAVAWPAERVDDRLAGRIAGTFVLGKQRTPTQDVEFCVDQLVEVAARALSPGLNDPFTAIACVDRLAASLARLAERQMPSAYRYDPEGRLRVAAEVFTFAGVVDAAFNPIRQYARSQAAVTIRLLEAVARVAARLGDDPDRRGVLLRHARLIEQGSREGLPEEQDRQDVEERFRAAVRVLEAGPEAPRPAVTA